MRSDATQPPRFHPTTPGYPATKQVVRVFAIKDAAANTYRAYLQQFDDRTGKLRDRVEVTAWEPNKAPLNSAFYKGQLVGAADGPLVIVSNICCLPRSSFPSVSSPSPSGVSAPSSPKVSSPPSLVPSSPVSLKPSSPPSLVPSSPVSLKSPSPASPSPSPAPSSSLPPCDCIVRGWTKDEGTNITLPVPPGTQVGDLMLVFITADTTADDGTGIGIGHFVPDPTWTFAVKSDPFAVTGKLGFTARVFCYYKRYALGAPASTWGDGDEIVGFCTSIGNADVRPVQKEAQLTTSPNPTAPALPVDNVPAIIFAHFGEGTTTPHPVSPPADFTDSGFGTYGTYGQEVSYFKPPATGVYGPFVGSGGVLNMGAISVEVLCCRVGDSGSPSSEKPSSPRPSPSSSSSGTVTPCCPGVVLPDVLHGTISATTGTCNCLPASFTLTKTGPLSWAWSAAAPTCSPQTTFQGTLCCDPLSNVWHLIGTVCGWGGPNCDGGLAVTTAQCSPLSLVWTGISCGGLCGGTFTLTITL